MEENKDYQVYRFDYLTEGSQLKLEHNVYCEDVNKEANDSATAKSLATAAVGLSGASLLWNIAMLALSITMKRKRTTFHR